MDDDGLGRVSGRTGSTGCVKHVVAISFLDSMSR